MSGPHRKRALIEKKRISHVSSGNSRSFFLYILPLLCLLFLIWLVSELKEKRKRYQPPGKKLWRCSICAHVYIADRDESLTKCPRCGNLQEKNDDQ